VLLSGGIDSSANAIALSTMVSKPIKAFTVGFSNDIKGYKNEFEPAKQIAKLCNAQHFELQLTQKDFLDFLPQMIWHQDEPNADAANIPIYYISKLAKQQGVTVILGGEGSDELLIGYKVMQDAHRFHTFMQQHPKLKKHVLNAAFALPALQKRKTLEYNWLQNLQQSPHFFRTTTDLETEQNKQNNIFTPDFAAQIKHYDPNQKFAQYHQDFTNSGRTHFYDWASYIELNYRLPELLLSRLDKMTMAASVEGRTPFLDVNFVEMAMRLPPHTKVQQNQEKYLLKQALKNTLPHNILHRPKDGFTIPMQHLLAHELLAYSQEIIIDFNKSTGVFQQKYLQHILQPNPTPQVADKLWVALNLAMWWQKFIK
jgi:asparagine synthase (glutamine-hydrolysing)